MLTLHSEMKNEKFKYYLEKILNVMRRFKKEALQIWKREVFPEKFNAEMKVAKKVMLRWLRRYQKKALSKWIEFTTYHRKVTSFFSQGPTRMKSNVLRAWKDYKIMSKKMRVALQEATAKRVILRWIAKYQMRGFTKWVEFTTYHRRVTSFFNQGPQRMKANVFRALKLYKNQSKIEKQTLVHRNEENARRVIIRWLRKYQKTALDKWVEFTSYHRRVTSFFDQGPTRMKTNTLRQWKSYVIDKKKLEKAAQTAIAKRVILRWLAKFQRKAFIKWMEFAAYHRRVTSFFGQGPQRMKANTIRQWKSFVQAEKAGKTGCVQGQKILTNFMQTKTKFQVARYFRKWVGEVAFWKQQLAVYESKRFRAKSVILRWLRREQKKALDHWANRTKYIKSLMKSTRQGTRLLAAIVNRKASFNKFKKFYIWCKLTTDHKVYHYHYHYHYQIIIITNRFRMIN